MNTDTQFLQAIKSLPDNSVEYFTSNLQKLEDGNKYMEYDIKIKYKTSIITEDNEVPFGEINEELKKKLIEEITYELENDLVDYEQITNNESKEKEEKRKMTVLNKLTKLLSDLSDDSDYDCEGKTLGVVVDGEVKPIADFLPVTIFDDEENKEEIN